MKKIFVLQNSEELSSLKGYINHDKIRKDTKENIDTLNELAQRFYANFFRLI